MTFILLIQGMSFSFQQNTLQFFSNGNPFSISSLFNFYMAGCLGKKAGFSCENEGEFELREERKVEIVGNLIEKI